MDRRFFHGKGVKGTYLLFSILWLAAGLALLIWPRFSSEVICTALGFLCILYGVVRLIGYFSNRQAFRFDLVMGLLCLILGAVLVFFSRTLLSLLPVIVGIYAVVSGIFKLQTALDARRAGLNKWWGILLLSLATIVLGVILLLRPFDSAMFALRFVGLAMILSGVEDLTSTAYTVKAKPNGTVIDVDDFEEV